MRTPIHAKPVATGAQAIDGAPGYDSETVMLRGLYVYNGPRDAEGRKVRVLLTRSEAQELAAQLAALLAD